MSRKFNRFYKTSPQGFLGSNLVFWAKEGAGYTTNLDQAHVYTFDEAQDDVVNGRLRGDGEYPISADHVDALSILKVDCQYINDEFPSLKDENGEYVAYKNNCWDGNDLSFCTGVGHSFNYQKAKIFKESEIEKLDFDGFTLIPKSIADKVARRTFPFSSVNRRKMIQGAGIVGLRKKRKYQSKGMSMFNCPSCGRINWQYNPYDFIGCTNIDCDEYKGLFERNELFRITI